MKKPELVAITAPTVRSPEGHLLTAEDFIVYCARVSNPSNQHNLETAPKLLAYLVKQGHWSPFDMVHMTCFIHTSRAIMAQVLRHWSFRFQEFSQRYSAIADGTDWSHVEGRIKAQGGNRQGSATVDFTACDFMQDRCRDAAENYQSLIDHKESPIAPECARMIMPLATPTTAYMTGSVRSWMTYFWQRLDAHAQKEHRELASGLFDIFREQFPNVAQMVATHRPTVIETAPDWLP